MKKFDHGAVLRWGFGIFFLFWGIERVARTSTWANDDFLGSYYGEWGAVYSLVFAVGVVEILIALSFFFRIRAKFCAFIGLLIVLASTFVCIRPFFTYFIMGVGAPVPNMLFIDHAPLLAGLIAILDHEKSW